MYRMVIIANTIVSYTWMLLRELTRDRMEVVANTLVVVVVILQFISVANQYLAHINLHNILYQLYLNKAGEKKEYPDNHLDFPC